MNIVYIISSTNSNAGASKSFMTLLRGLKDKGIMASVVIPDRHDLYKEFKRMGIPAYVLPIRFNVYPEYNTFRNLLLFLPRLAYWQILNTFSVIKLTRLLRNKHIDIIHTNVGVINVGFRVAKKLRIPHIYHIREYADKDFNLHYFPTKSRFMQQVCAPNSYSICITDDIKRHHNLCDIKSAVTIYNGVCDSNNLTVSNEKSNYFLFVGRIEQAKGLDSLIKAYCTYVKKSPSIAIPLYIAGEVNDNCYYSNILNYISSEDIKDKVHFLGPRKDVAKLMQQAKAIIIPSVFEGFGRCLAEAMFNGCLTIGHNTGGTKEQFDNGKRLTGQEIGLRYDTVDQLTEHLHTISSNTQDKFATMINNASKVACKLYSNESYVSNVYNLYKEIIYDTTH